MITPILNIYNALEHYDIDSKALDINPKHQSLDLDNLKFVKYNRIVFESFKDASDSEEVDECKSTSSLESMSSSSSETLSAQPDSFNNGTQYYERCVVNCTPSIAFSKEMQDYIDLQVNSNKNKWIYDILDGKKEKDSILLETDEFVFLPDTHAVNDNYIYNWLAIVKDRRLRTLRDLDAEHIPMLKRIKMACVDYIQGVTQYNSHNIMAYVHYLPSVYQLHIHFCAPYGCYTTMDALKIYPLDSIISNLQIDGSYFRKVGITTVIYGNPQLLSIFNVSVSPTSSKLAIDIKNSCGRLRYSRCKFCLLNRAVDRDRAVDRAVDRAEASKQCNPRACKEAKPSRQCSKKKK